MKKFKYIMVFGLLLALEGDTSRTTWSPIIFSGPSWLLEEVSSGEKMVSYVPAPDADDYFAYNVMYQSSFSGRRAHETVITFQPEKNGIMHMVLSVY